MSTPGITPPGLTPPPTEIIIITPRDPAVVHPPTDLQGPPWQSRYIFNPNQPWPPVLATRFFPPPPWPENLEGDNLTIEPVVGPFLALTPEQMETPPSFGRFPPGFSPFLNPNLRERRLEERAVERELNEDRPRRRGRPRRERAENNERPTSDWPSGGGAE